MYTCLCPTDVLEQLLQHLPLIRPLVTCVADYVALPCQTFVSIDSLCVYSMRDSWNQPCSCTILLDNVFIHGRRTHVRVDVQAGPELQRSIFTDMYTCCKRPSIHAPWISLASLVVGESRYQLEWITPLQYAGCLYVYPVPMLNIEVVPNGQTRANGFTYDYVVDTLDNHLDAVQTLEWQDRQLHDYDIMTKVESSNSRLQCCRCC
jgi:hypothetical protein